MSSPPSAGDASHRLSSDPRLQALHRYDILDTLPEEAFDRIVDLAAHVFDAPTAFISFVGDDPPWSKATAGTDAIERALDTSVCTHVVRTEATLVVEDATSDARFPDPSDASAPRFYAGAPLVSPDGHVLGALCVLDPAPRAPTEASIRQLENLAEMVVDELELRREVAERTRVQSRERMQSHILEQVAQGAPLREILADLVTAIEERCAPRFASIQLYDASENCIRHGAAPSLPQAYNDAVDGCPVGPAAGSCGTAMHRGERVVVEDIRTDPRWDEYRDLALHHGLRACWATPIVGSDNEILGTFSLYDREPSSPRESDHVLIEEAHSLARVAIERHRDVEALKASEQRRRTFMERSPVGIYRTTPDGEVRYANDAFARLLGFDSAERLCSHNLQENGLANYDREAFMETLEAKGHVVQREATFQRIDGSEVHVLESAHLAEEKGEPVYVGIVEDITERKEAEGALRQSRERWQRLVENQRDAIHISVDGVIQYANPASADLVGAESADDLVGRTLHSFMGSETAKARLTKRLEDISEGDAVPPREHDIQRLDGERRVVESYAVPVDYKGQRAAQWTTRDLTERKRTQRQLRQAQKMETVGTLAGGVAHDFTNIIHAVRAYVQLVRDDLPPGHSSYSLLEQATQGLSRAEDLVEKLLTFSRQETATQTVRVNLGDVVRESIELVTPSLSVDLSIRTDLDAECTTLGDPGELHQVATNLITNAAQAMESTPTEEENVLDIDVRRIDVDRELARRHLNLEPGAYVCMSVSDTGPGMDGETQERIFEPFFTTKEVGEGTGLGLSVVHGIVQSHDGEVALYSEVGEGTTFDVYLPHESDQQTPTASDRSDDIETHQGRILFVDDDASITELETVRLRRLGYEVTTCASAAEALQTFDQSSTPFDLILTDYAMPGAGGLDLTRALRARDYTNPIVLLSGFSAQVSPKEMNAAGVTAFLRKPVGNEELRHTLQRLQEASST